MNPTTVENVSDHTEDEVFSIPDAPPNVSDNSDQPAATVVPVDQKPATVESVPQPATAPAALQPVAAKQRVNTNPFEEEDDDGPEEVGNVYTRDPDIKPAGTRTPIRFGSANAYPEEQQWWEKAKTGIAQSGGYFAYIVSLNRTNHPIYEQEPEESEELRDARHQMDLLAQEGAKVEAADQIPAHSIGHLFAALDKLLEIGRAHV